MIDTQNRNARSAENSSSPYPRSIWLADDPDTKTITKTKPVTKRPNMYRVLVLNDDYTPMDFVVFVLQKIFHMDQETAVSVMLHVHQNGSGECGVFPYEVAESKVTMVMDLARKNEHPLQCVMEKN